MSKLLEDYSNATEVVNYGKDDVADKYGQTKKMRDIWELVEDGKTLDDVDWKVTEEDKDYYAHCKFMDDLLNDGNDGKKRRYAHYFND